MHPLIKSALLILILCISNNAFATKKSLFWKLESPAGVTSYLFGIIDTDDARASNFSSIIISAIKQVDIVMISNSDSTDPRLTMIRDFNLEKKLSREEFDKVQLLAEYHGMYLENIVSMKPLMLASLFFYTRPISSSTQKYLFNRKFAEMRKKIEYIESPKEYYSRMVDIFKIEEQLLILRNALTFTQAEKEKRYQQLIEAYLGGDLDAINTISLATGNRLMPASLRERYKEQKHVHFALLAKRSIAAATKKSVFFALSVDDLAGNDGIVAAFKGAGFKVSPIIK